MWNVLDYTALCLTAGTVSKEIAMDSKSSKVKGYEPRNAIDKIKWELYDLDKMHGRPAGLQLIGRRYDEKILGSAQQVNNAIRAGQ
jgi:hypothetical protein